MLDDIVAQSLELAPERLRVRSGRVLRYRREVAPFLVTPQDLGENEWADLERLVQAGETVLIDDRRLAPPSGWSMSDSIAVTQMIGPMAAPDPGEELASVLGEPDAADIADLLHRCGMRYSGPQVWKCGLHVGVRAGNGQLAAMAGFRFRAEGWAEIASMCTAPAHRGRGHATRLLATMLGAAHAEGRRTLLHVEDCNEAALRLYRAAGFQPRTRRRVAVLTRAVDPAAAAAGDYLTLVKE